MRHRLPAGRRRPGGDRRRGHADSGSRHRGRHDLGGELPCRRCRRRRGNCRCGRYGRRSGRARPGPVAEAPHDPIGRGHSHGRNRGHGQRQSPRRGTINHETALRDPTGDPRSSGLPFGLLLFQPLQRLQDRTHGRFPSSPLARWGKRSPSPARQMKRSVSSSIAPSAGIPLLAWNRCTAWRVAGSSLRVTLPS